MAFILCFKAILHQDIWKAASSLKEGPPQSPSSPFEPVSWPPCVVRRGISCQHCLPTTAACRWAPRKRSHRGQKRRNRGFKFYVFPENKGICGCVWGTLWELSQWQKHWGAALLWSGSRLKAPLLFEARGKNWYLQASLEEPHLTSGSHVKPSVLYFHSVWS